MPQISFTFCKIDTFPEKPALFSICIFDKANRTDFTQIIKVLASKQRKRKLFDQTVLVGYSVSA